MIPLGMFPTTRLRRNRADPWSRRLVAEARLSADDLIWPVFVGEDGSARVPVPSMPGVDRLGLEVITDAVGVARDLGIPAIALFPCPSDGRRSEGAEEAVNPDNLMCRAIRAVKKAHPDVGVICDVALDPYTTHGHDGLMRDGRIVNDETVEVLVRQALVQAEAGADVLAPSDMMDGRVGAIRKALDNWTFTDARIMTYAAKYASAFYGPFRDAVGSGTVLQGDKRTYQMDPANGDEALREVALDLQEGADMVIVKPGLPYLDIVRRIRETFGIPTFAYHVSGEYAMLRAAANSGWLDYERALLEVLISFRRAGCDGVLTYAAIDAARLLRAASG